MARIRTIKPEFWEDETIGLLSREARLLFIACWTAADDEGRLRWAPPYLKATAFIYDDDIDADRIAEIMTELEEAGVVAAYRGPKGFERYAHVVNFSRHQVINRPTPSRLPPPDSRNVHGGLPEDSKAESETEKSREKPEKTPEKQPLTEQSRSAPGMIMEDSRREGKGREGNVERKGTTPPTPRGQEPILPEERAAREWCDIRGIVPTRSVLKEMIPRVRDYMTASGQIPTRTQLEEFARRGIKTPGGWGYGTAREGEELSDAQWDAIYRGEA